MSLPVVMVVIATSSNKQNWAIEAVQDHVLLRFLLSEDALYHSKLDIMGGT